MKVCMKKVSAVLMAVALLCLSFMPTAVSAAENGADPAYQIGDAKYDTLKEAIGAVKDGETITLLRDVEGATGVSVPEGKNFVLDFNGYNYVLGGPGAGSQGTETNGFQLLKNSTITFKNGIISVDGSTANPVKRIIQNYANLTLENMVIYTQGLGANEDYALSFNNGDIVFKGETVVMTSTPDVIAFDVCKFSSYPGATVTFDDSFVGCVSGKIVYDSPNPDTHKLVIKGNGSFAGIDATKGNEEAAKGGVTVYSGSFAESVKEYLAEELKVELNGVMDENYPYRYFKTVEEALANSNDGDVITDLSVKPGDKVFNIELDYGFGKDITTIKGTSVTLTKLEAEGYKFVGWFVGDKKVELGEVTVTEDTRFVAKWEKLQPVGPEGQNPGQGGNSEVEVVPTGDTNNFMGYFAIMLVAGVASVVVYRKSRAK